MRQRPSGGTGGERHVAEANQLTPMKKQTNNTVPLVPLARLVRRGRGHEYKLWVYDGPKNNPRFLAGITFDRRNPPNKTDLARWERAIQAGLDAEFNSPPNLVFVDDMAELERQLAEAREDVVMASGELMIPMPKPGSDIARLLAANSIMRRQRDEAREQRDRLAELLLEADRYVHTCPFKARIRAALEAMKGGSDE